MAPDGTDAGDPGPARHRLLVLDAATWLLERGELDSARAVFACSIEIEPPLESSAGGGLFVRLIAPADVAQRLLNEERPESWQVRNAVGAVLPPGFWISELVVESETCAGHRLAAAA